MKWIDSLQSQSTIRQTISQETVRNIKFMFSDISGPIEYGVYVSGFHFS